MTENIQEVELPDGTIGYATIDLGKRWDEGSLPSISAVTEAWFRDELHHIRFWLNAVDALVDENAFARWRKEFTYQVEKCQPSVGGKDMVKLIHAKIEESVELEKFRDLMRRAPRAVLTEMLTQENKRQEEARVAGTIAPRSWPPDASFWLND